MSTNRFVIIACIAVFWLIKTDSFLCAQIKADSYFRSGQYNAAAKLYEKQLQKNNNSHVKTRLAFCYRMCNQLEKTYELYTELVSREQVKPEIFYYFAESLTQREQYDSAALMYRRYLQVEPKDLLNAQTALRNLDAIKLIRPYFPDVVVVPFARNSEQDDNSPFFLNNTLIFNSDRNPGFRLLKEKSNVTGRDYLNIYESKILGDTLFGEPALYGRNINQQNYNTGAFSCTKDGKFAYFEQNSTFASKNGTYLIKIFRVEADGHGWKNPEMLPFCSEEMNFMHPCISADGNELFFVSGKPNSKNRTDIYHTTLNQDGTWRAIENLGTVINTPFSEGYPSIYAEGRLFFASKGHPGYGGFDLFVSTRDSLGSWTPPINLGKPLNSALDDISFTFFSKRNAGAFSSSRNGGDDDIFFFRNRDSSSIFGVQQNNPSDKGPSEAGVSGKKLSIDAANHLTIEASQMDFCSLFHFCTLTELHKRLGQRPDSNLLNENWILDKISFNGSKLAKDSTTSWQLDSLISLLQHYPFNYQINVHCFSATSDKANRDLSKRRALAIAKRLRSGGIDNERLTINGWGNRSPICKGKDCEAYGSQALVINERIELKIIGFNSP